MRFKKIENETYIRFIHSVVHVRIFSAFPCIQNIELPKYIGQNYNLAIKNLHEGCHKI